MSVCTRHLVWLVPLLTWNGIAQPTLPDRFDVISIKPTPPSEIGAGWSPAPGGRFSAKGIALRELIAVAYGVQPFQVVGGPRWIATDRWTVEAKAENFDGSLNRDQLQRPLQQLLAGRFKLRSRRETKEMPVYVLTAAPGGPKLKPAKEPSSAMGFGRGFLNAKAANLDLLARVLETLLERPVLNQSGIAGEYEIYLEWSPQPGEGASVLGPDADLPDRGRGSIFSEIRDQLGLRLDSKRARAEIVTVDGAEQPDSN